MIRASFTGPTGQTPAAVAATVLEAIRTDRFWIVTHAEERPIVEARGAGILDSFPPTAGSATDGQARA